MADIITYPENGITYDADDASGYLATRLSGVYSAEEDFAVTAQGGLSVQVSAGQAWAEIDECSGYVYLAQEGESGNTDFSVQSVKSMIRTDKGE